MGRGRRAVERATRAAACFETGGSRAHLARLLPPYNCPAHRAASPQRFTIHLCNAAPSAPAPCWTRRVARWWVPARWTAPRPVSPSRPHRCHAPERSGSQPVVDVRSRFRLFCRHGRTAGHRKCTEGGSAGCVAAAAAVHAASGTLEAAGASAPWIARSGCDLPGVSNAQPASWRRRQLRPAGQRARSAPPPL